MLLVSPTAYFPPLSYFLAAQQQGSWQWEACENYQKGGYRNRCHIAGPNRLELLTIPLEKGKHQSTPIQSVAISYKTDWVRHHQLSIQAAYGRAPFYEFYVEDFFQILAAEHEHLWTLNLAIQQQLLACLQLDLPFSFSEQFKPVYSNDVTDLRPRGSQSPVIPLPYPQLFQERHGFRQDVAVLDLLFCQGPAAGAYLRKYKK